MFQENWSKRKLPVWNRDHSMEDWVHDRHSRVQLEWTLWHLRIPQGQCNRMRRLQDPNVSSTAFFILCTSYSIDDYHVLLPPKNSDPFGSDKAISDHMCVSILSLSYYGFAEISTMALAWVKNSRCFRLKSWVEKPTVKMEKVSKVL